MEVTHTLRLYDPEFIAKLGALMEREKEYHRTKNEFMTRIVKLGYESYMAAVRKREELGEVMGTIVGIGILTDKGKKKRGHKAGAPEVKSTSKNFSETGEESDIYLFMSELAQYFATQFKTVNTYFNLFQKLLSSVYNITLLGGEDIIAEKAEDGFFDDLPARFEKIILNLGLSGNKGANPLWCLS